MKSFLVCSGQFIFSILMYCMGIMFFGVALTPGISLVFKVWKMTQAMETILRFLILGFSVAAGYFLFGFSLIILCGFTRAISGLCLKEGDYPIFSLGAMKWAFCGCLQLMLGFTFMDFILLTPFANIMLKLLGARLGRNAQINSKFIADASLLEIGDNTVIGGAATIICHIVEHGILKLRKVKIGKNVTIGLNAVIMPGCEIGDNAIIGAGAVLLKNTKVGPGAIYVGVPAEPLQRQH